MLLNLSNHPSALWPAPQIKAAGEYGKITDIPFPAIDPALDSRSVYQLACEYAGKCFEILEQSTDKTNAVHIMGELTFTYALVTLLQKNNIRCIASTTEREVKSEKEGIKTSRFRFVRFREYPLMTLIFDQNG